jgi:hypothetical protein
LGSKPIALLILLAAAGPSGFQRRALRELLWEGSSDANSSNSMRQAVFQIRHLLGADSVVEVGGRLVLDTPIRVDIIEAERLLAEGRLTEALNLLVGPIGKSLDIAGAALRGWIRDFQARLEHRLLDNLDRGWRAATRSPAPGLFAPTLARAQEILGEVPYLLWCQLELAATIGDGGGFDQLARRVSTSPSGAGTRAEAAARLHQLRGRLQAQLTSGDGAGAEPIHGEALRSLVESWRDALAGRGSAIALLGDHGTGRTWLLRELSRRCLAEGARTVPLVARASAASVPTSCLRDLAASVKGYRGAAGMQPDYIELIDRLHEGMLSPKSDAIPAVHDLLSAVTAEGPLLVSLDDAQWYDSRTLSRLLLRLREHPVPGLLVVAVLTSGAGLGDLPRITLGPARPDGIRTLLSSMARLPRAEWVSPLIDSLYGASAGRPGRAAEAIMRLYGAGLLRVIDDRWALATTLAETLEALETNAA